MWCIIVPVVHKIICDAKRISLGKEILALPHDNPVRKDMTEYYKHADKKEILERLESDPSYVKRKLELQSALTPEVVQELFLNASQNKTLEGQCFMLCFGSTQAITRSIRKEAKTGDFLGIFPLTLNDLKEVFPNSTSLQGDTNNKLFVTVAHVFPLRLLHSDLQDLTIHHSLTTIKR